MGKLKIFISHSLGRIRPKALSSSFSPSPESSSSPTLSPGPKSVYSPLLRPASPSLTPLGHLGPSPPLLTRARPSRPRDTTHRRLPPPADRLPKSLIRGRLPIRFFSLITVLLVFFRFILYMQYFIYTYTNFVHMIFLRFFILIF